VPTKTRRGNCLVLPHTGYALAIHYVTFMGLQRRLRAVYMEHPRCKAVFGRKFSLSPESGHKMAVFRELRGVNVKLLSSNPEKAHNCAEPRRLTYYA